MSRYPIAFFLVLFVMASFLTHGCYTAFRHPPVDKSWGKVYVTDDCLECHDSSPYAAPILPQSAQDDVHWQFYSGSAWWQDEMTITTGAAPEPAGTGPRNFGNSVAPQAAPPVSMPVQGGGSLGKSNVSDQNDENKKAVSGPTRSAGRRSHTTSSGSSQDNSAKGSRKR